MRDPDTIEREIALERERLAQSLRALDARLSPQAIVARAGQALRGPAEAASDAARDNPLALALIGSGVAWMMAGNSRGTGNGDPAADAPDAPGPSAAAYDPRIGPTAQGLPDAAPDMAGFDARLAAADQAMRRTETADQKGASPMAMTGTGLHETDTHFSEPRSRRDQVRQTARDLRARLYDGLDQLPDAARARILEARLKAIEAQHAIEARVARGSDQVRRSAQDNPLLLGAIAFGLGAALAAALPRSSVENRTLGAHRDQLLDEADRTWREETAKLRNVAEAAVAEGKAAVKDTLQSGPPTEDDPAERVHKAAKREAKRQGVGNVN